MLYNNKKSNRSLTTRRRGARGRGSMIMKAFSQDMSNSQDKPKSSKRSSIISRVFSSNQQEGIFANNAVCEKYPGIKEFLMNEHVIGDANVQNGIQDLLNRFNKIESPYEMRSVKHAIAEAKENSGLSPLAKVLDQALGNTEVTKFTLNYEGLSDRVKIVLEKITDEPTHYSSQDIINMLQGNPVESTARKTLSHDPHSGVMMILGDLHASLKYADMAKDYENIGSVPVNKILRSATNALRTVMAIDKVGLSYKARTQKTTPIVKRFTAKCMKRLKMDNKDFMRMKAHGSFRVGRSTKKYEAGGYSLTYNPQAGVNLTDAQLSLNNRLLTKEKKDVFSGKMVSKYSKDKFGVKNQVIFDEIKRCATVKGANTDIGSSKGREMAKCSNLIRLDLTTKDVANNDFFKIKATTHSDWTPTDGNLDIADRDEVTKLNLYQTLQVGGIMPQSETSSAAANNAGASKFEPKTLFVTKNLMSNTKIGGLLEPTMLSSKKAAMGELKKDPAYGHVKPISLMHTLNHARELVNNAKVNHDEYKELFTQLLHNLGADVEAKPGADVDNILQAITYLSQSECSLTDPGTSNDFQEKLNDIRNMTHDDNYVLSAQQRHGLDASAKIAKFLSTDYKPENNRTFEFEISALDTIAISGICGDKALIDSHCKSGKDRTFSEFIFSMTMSEFVSSEGYLPNLSNEEGNNQEQFATMYQKIWMQGIAQRHASQDNVGCYGLKSMIMNMPSFILSKLTQTSQVIKSGPEEWNNISAEKITSKLATSVSKSMKEVSKLSDQVNAKIKKRADQPKSPEPTYDNNHVRTRSM